MTPQEVKAAIEAAAAAMSAHAEELTALDQAIGDGDHGLNMKRGFDAVLAEADEIAARPLPEGLKAIGTKLVMTVGGASGPLYGTLFIALGRHLPQEFGRAELATALSAAIEAVAARGKSAPGQKTMLDTLVPVRDALAEGASAEALVAVADAAAQATKPMKAIRGRASFLGDRSIGHVDPGARSAALLLRAVVSRIGVPA